MPVGAGGGNTRLGQLHVELLLCLSDSGADSSTWETHASSVTVPTISPMVENYAVIIPRAVHASLLRNSLSELSVTYTI